MAVAMGVGVPPASISPGDLHLRLECAPSVTLMCPELEVQAAQVRVREVQAAQVRALEVQAAQVRAREGQAAQVRVREGQAAKVRAREGQAAQVRAREGYGGAVFAWCGGGCREQWVGVLLPDGMMGVGSSSKQRADVL